MGKTTRSLRYAIKQASAGARVFFVSHNGAASIAARARTLSLLCDEFPTLAVGTHLAEALTIGDGVVGFVEIVQAEDGAHPFRAHPDIYERVTRIVADHHALYLLDLAERRRRGEDVAESFGGRAPAMRGEVQ